MARFLLRTLDYPHVIRLVADIVNAGPESGTTLDFSEIQFVKPFGAVWLAAALQNTAVDVVLPKSKSDAVDYAAHVGLFDELHIDVSRAFGAARAGLRYVPITKIRAMDVLGEASRRGVNPQKIILERAGALAQVLTQSDDGDLFVGIRWAIKEILRNALEHSKSDAVWACAQLWPGTDLVQVGIADAGMGILNHLSYYYTLPSAERAIELALEPGITGADLSPGSPNSGFGLYATRELCLSAGSFMIASSGVARFDRNAVTYLNSGVDGTGVRMEVSTNSFHDMEETLEGIFAQGEALAAKGKGRRATRVSRGSGLDS